MASRNGHGPDEPAGRRRSRLLALVVGAIVLLAVAFGGGYLLAGGDDEPSSPSPPPVSPSPSAEPTASDQVTPTTSASPASMRFDLAEFLTDEAAQDAAGNTATGRSTATTS